MSAGKRINKAVSSVMFEGLESRQLFNAIAWTGAGDGVNWSNSANWSGGVVPGFADDVTISVAANPNIQLSGSRVVHSLVNAESLTINGSGSSLTTNSTVSSSGIITMNNALIAGGSWNFSGAGHIEIAGNSQNQIGTGAMINGDINLAAANGRVSIVSNSTFYNIHLAADATSVAFPANSTIAGNIYFEGAGTGGRYVEGFNQAGSLLISSSGSIRAAAGFAGTGYIGTAQWFGNSIGTLNNGGIIASDFGGRPINITTTSFHNTVGIINAKSGGTVNISSPNWTNDDTGTINVNGGTVTTSGTWSNAGTINLLDGTINFGGTFSASTFDWASFHRSGGTVNLAGTLNNNIPALTLDANLGTWNLKNGAINGGVLNFNGATLSPTDSGGTLQDVTVNGDLIANSTNAHFKVLGTTTFNSIHLSADGAGVGFAPGFTLNAPIMLDGAGTGARYVETVGAGTFTISAGGTIDTDTGFGGAAYVGLGTWYGSQMTLTNNGTIRSDVAASSVSVNPSAMFNYGVVIATNGSTMSLNGNEWHNKPNGIIRATDSTLNFGNVWGSLGLINLVNSTLNLGGSFATSELNIDPGIFTRDAASNVNITGNLNNNSLVLWQNNDTGNWKLKGGTISGGFLSYANGHKLDYTSSGGTLKDLTVNGDVTVDTNNARVTIAGTTSFSTLHLSGDNTAVAFANNYTLNSAVVLEGAGAGSRSIEAAGTGTTTIGTTGSIRTLAGFGGTTYIGQSGTGMTLVNNGLIQSLVPGRLMYIGGVQFTNNNAVQIADGTLTIQPANWSNAAGGFMYFGSSTVNFNQHWQNFGTLGVSNGNTLNLGGTWRTPEFNFNAFTNSASNVNVTGQLDNGDSVIHLNSTTGSWRLAGGTISGGQIRFDDVSTTFGLSSTAGKLQGVTVHGDIFADVPFARALITTDSTFDTLHLTGDGSSVQLEGGYVLNGGIEFGGAGTSGRGVQLYTAGSLTVGSTGSIKTIPGFGGSASMGQDQQPMQLINNGTISSSVAGHVLNVVPQTGLTINGSMQAINGGELRVFNVGPMIVNSGATASANSIRANSLTIDTGASVTLTPSGSMWDVSTLKSLAINGSGSFDLNDNDLLIDYTGASPRAAVQTMLASGRAAGAWTGAGIRSTAAKNNARHNTTLGLLEATEFRPINGGGFDGQTIDDTALLLKYTYYGDTDLNGVINFDDYSRTDSGFNGHKSGWLNGDFDGNGVVNFDDYSLIDLAFNTQGSAL